MIRIILNECLFRLHFSIKVAGSYYFNTKTNDLLCRLTVMKLYIYIIKVLQGFNVLTLADTAVLNPRISKMRNVTFAFIS